MLHKLESRSVGFLCLIVTSVGWGLNWPAMKVLLRELPPLFARGTAGMAAALIIALIAVKARQSLAVPRDQVGRLIVSAMFNIFAWMGLSTVAMRWLSAGQGALLVYTMPVWVTLLAWPILGKRPAVLGIAGLALSIAGVSLLFGGHAFTRDLVPGIAFALAAAFLFALGTLVLKPLAMPALASVAWQLAIGCLPMVAFGLLVENPDLSAVTAAGWSVMIYMTIVPMGVCYITWFAALRRLPPTMASVATLLTPVVGVLAAAVSLGEPLGIREFTAMSLTLAGIGLAIRAPRG